MKRSLLIAAAVASLVAAAVWRLSPRATVEVLEAPVAPAAPSATPLTQAPAPSQPERPCRFSAGQTMAFDLTSTTTVSLSEEVLKYAGDHRPDGSASARMTLEVVRVEDSSAILLARLTDVSGALDTPEEGMTHAWLTRINERCEVAGFARHASTRRKLARQQQALLHELSFAVPRGPGPEAISFDTSVGTASGLLQLVATEGAHTYLRAIQRYESVWSPSMNGVVVERSQARVRRGDALWFESLSGSEEISVPGVMSRGVSSISAVARPADPSTLAGFSRNEAEYVWENCFNEVPDSALRPAGDTGHQQRVAAMKNVAYPDALELMLTKLETSTNIQEQSRDMAAFLDAHPEAIPEYAGALLTEFEPEWKAAGFLVLANTQNVGAREVLLDVWRERNAQEMDRIRASLALASRKDVGLPLAKEMLAEARRDGTPTQRNVSRQALLHVGVLAGLHPEDQAVMKEVRGGLVAQLGAQKTPQETEAVYLAMGNTGDVSLLPELERASRNPDPAWRSIVPVGMRRMPVDAVREFTVAWLRRETSPDVMRELFEVIHHQYVDAGRVVDDELASIAVAYLRRQPRILTRQSILRMTAPLVSTNDDVRAAFRDQLKVEYETNTGMFSYVASALPEEDVAAALASIPSLADQHRGEQLRPLVRASPQPVPTVSPVDLLPKMTQEAP